MAKKVCAHADAMMNNCNPEKAIQVSVAESIIFAFSPIAKVERIYNGNYLITITDKYGTTTAQVPNLTDEVVTRVVDEYFRTHPVIQEKVQEKIDQHNADEQAHAYIRGLIQQAVDTIPTKMSDLQNDSGFVTNAKEIMVTYNTREDFPENPSDAEKDMIFYDNSTGDTYLYGLQGQTYSSIGLAHEDILSGGNAFS